MSIFISKKIKAYLLKKFGVRLNINWIYFGLEYVFHELISPIVFICLMVNFFPPTTVYYVVLGFSILRILFPGIHMTTSVQCEILTDLCYFLALIAKNTFSICSLHLFFIFLVLLFFIDLKRFCDFKKLVVSFLLNFIISTYLNVAIEGLILFLEVLILFRMNEQKKEFPSKSSNILFKNEKDEKISKWIAYGIKG
ncbi:MAG: accessory gene regulator B family protein, partial [Allobaculum sp.]|nr:accessory gene regulator B family protein [Allobaculum sp.]